MTRDELLLEARKLSAQAALLEADAAKLRQQARDLSIPERWEVGQKVRYLRDRYWAWSAGAEAVIIEMLDHGKTAREYQVFYTRPINGKGTFWTTPDDVELA